MIRSLQEDHRSIVVTWTDPVDKNGVIDRYLIEWRNAIGDSGSDSVSENACSYEIPDLQACQIYDVTVKTHTGGGWGEESEAESAAIPNFSKS